MSSIVFLNSQLVLFCITLVTINGPGCRKTPSNITERSAATVGLFYLVPRTTSAKAFVPEVRQAVRATLVYGTFVVVVVVVACS